MVKMSTTGTPYAIHAHEHDKTRPHRNTWVVMIVQVLAEKMSNHYLSSLYYAAKANKGKVVPQPAPSKKSGKKKVVAPVFLFPTAILLKSNNLPP